EAPAEEAAERTRCRFHVGDAKDGEGASLTGNGTGTGTVRGWRGRGSKGDHRGAADDRRADEERHGETGAPRLVDRRPAGVFDAPEQRRHRRPAPLRRWVEAAGDGVV